MYKKTVMLSFMFVVLAGCASTDSLDTGVMACGVTMQVTINPNGELAQFKMYEPRCSDKSITPNLSAAWKKTACVQFTMNKPPTYKQGDSPRPLYYNFFFRPNRPNVLYRKVNSGGSESDPVIYVQESILESSGGICDGDLDA